MTNISMKTIHNLHKLLHMIFLIYYILEHIHLYLHTCNLLSMNQIIMLLSLFLFAMLLLIMFYCFKTED
jgi:hypothetical protein